MAVNPNQAWISPDVPYFALAGQGGSIGPNITVSTITVNEQLSLVAGAPGFPSAAIRFNKIGDPDDIMAEITHTINPQGDVAKELILIDELLDQYQPFSVGNLRVYGANGVIGNTPVINIREERDEVLGGPHSGIALLDANLVAMSAARISTLSVSSINNAPYPPPATIPTELTVSTLTASTISGNFISSGQGLFSTITGNTLTFNTMTSSNINTNFISTTNIVTRNITTSSINGQVINFSTTTGGSALFSSLVTANISSVFGDMTFQLVSTLAFNPSLGGVNLGGVNLGMGGFLGGLLGGIGSGLFNTIIGGAALTTGIIALTNSRGTNQINSNVYEMVNTTTQLQVSTLGQSTIRYLRLVSSINPNVIPGSEIITSSIIQAGTTCIRSLSDPVNLGNASVATSTIISFSSWVPLPTVTPENVSTISFASISSLTVSSINGQPYTPGGGGGGGGSFDFNAAMSQLSTIIKWNDDPFNRFIDATTQDLSNISTGYLLMLTGNLNATTNDRSNNNGIMNLRTIPQAFGGGQFYTGETTIVSGLCPILSTIVLSSMITMRNDSAAYNLASQPLLEIMRTVTGSDPDAPNMTFPQDYGNVALGNLYFSTMTGQPNLIQGMELMSTNGTGVNLNVITNQFVVNCNANGTGTILAPQAAPSTGCNINFHNIGGCLLGYYGPGSAFMGGGFQTGIQTLVFNAGVTMSNGYIRAVPGIPPFPPNSRINNQTFDIQAGMGGLQGTSNVPNGGTGVTGQGAWMPGTYLCHVSVGANGSNWPASFRYLHVFRTAANTFTFSWQIIAESGVYWNMASFPTGPPGTAITFVNTCGSTQPFVWSISGLNYIEGAPTI